MAILRATIGLEAASGLPADMATNTFHFDVIGVGTSLLDNVVDLIEDLYFNETEADPLADWISVDNAGTNYGIKIYDLADPEPRSPVREKFGTWTPSGGAGLPAEIALCASFQAAPESGENQARRRGRVYVPWIIAGANSNGRPSTALVNSVAGAFEEFWNAAEASVSLEWVVYSPTANASYGVAQGWVDNAWDVQRRRGVAPTGRTTWPA